MYTIENDLCQNYLIKSLILVRTTFPGPNPGKQIYDRISDRFPNIFSNLNSAKN